VRELEADPEMRKGRLIETIVRDASVDWDLLFVTLSMRGRHRTKLRWRRAVVEEAIRRPFLRGGARRRRRLPAPAPAPVPAATAAQGPGPGDHTGELDTFDPLDVWHRFCVTFPVLAIYRGGWRPMTPATTTTVDWDALWPGYNWKGRRGEGGMANHTQ
jgi:hypothetical protein